MVKGEWRLLEQQESMMIKVIKESRSFGVISVK